MKTPEHTILHWTIQILRRIVQVSVIILMVGMGYLSLYAHYRATHSLGDLVSEPVVRDDLPGEPENQEELGVEDDGPSARERILIQYDEQIEAMDDVQLVLDRNHGTVWSVQIAGLDLTDPLAAAEAIAASKTIYAPLLGSILIPVLVTLVLGKVFCSWICPANLLLEITGKLRHLLRFAEIPPAEVKFARANKYVLLAVGLLIAAIVGLPIFALVYPPAAVSRLVHGWIFGTSVTGILVLLAVIVVFELFVSPRWWCRVMCPGGALYGLIGWPRLWRVKLDADRCTNCRKCEPACEPGLNPQLESDGIECDNCGACIRRCPEQALRFGVGLPTIHKTKANRRKTPRAKAATIATVIAVALLAPATVHGHHILGLPHYSYKENYPQAPVLEYPATTGPYSVLLQSYPGKPNPGERVNLVFDIKNTKTGKRYAQPIKIRVLQTFTFGENREILSVTKEQLGDVLYKVYPTFPEEGEYIVELSMDVDGNEETIGFLMAVGNPSPVISILVAVGSALAVFLITVRAIKKKRQRRQQQEQTTTQHAQLETTPAT